MPYMTHGADKIPLI